MKEREERMTSLIGKRFINTPRESARESIKNESIRNAERNIKHGQKGKELN